MCFTLSWSQSGHIMEHNALRGIKHQDLFKYINLFTVGGAGAGRETEQSRKLLKWKKNISLP